MNTVISGQAPGDLRERFIDLVDAHYGGWRFDPEWSALCGKLWNCTDVMPHFTCTQLDIPQGTTYGAAARQLRAWWRRSAHTA